MINYLGRAYTYLWSVLEPVQQLLASGWLMGTIRQKFQRRQIRNVEVVTAFPTKSMDCSCRGFHPVHDLDSENVMKKLVKIKKTISWLQREIHDMEGFAVSGNFQPVLAETATSAGNAKILIDNLNEAMREVIQSFERDTAPAQ